MKHFILILSLSLSINFVARAVTTPDFEMQTTSSMMSLTGTSTIGNSAYGQTFDIGADTPLNGPRRAPQEDEWEEEPGGDPQDWDDPLIEPVGDNLVLILFAMFFAGYIAIRQRRKQTIKAQTLSKNSSIDSKSSTMNNSTTHISTMKSPTRILLTLALLVSSLFVSQSAWADTPEPITFKNCSTVTAYLSVKKSGSSPIHIYYKRGEDENATKIALSTTGTNISVTNGDSIQFWYGGTAYTPSTSVFIQFGDKTSSGDGYKVNNKNSTIWMVRGDLMSMQPDGQEIPKEYAFYKLFNGMTTIKDFSEVYISSNTLSKGCCESMCSSCSYATGSTPNFDNVTNIGEASLKNAFASCINLESISSFTKANVINKQGLYCTFQKCSCVVSCPTELKAKELGNEACYNMLGSCTSLHNLPKICATNVGYRSCYYMFSNCLIATTGPDTLRPVSLNVGTASYCYMFYKCQALQKAPVIMAVDLDSIHGQTASTAQADIVGSMYGMFASCSSLSEIEVRFKRWQNNGTTTIPTRSWVDAVANSGVFQCPSSLPVLYNLTHFNPKNPTYKWTINYLPSMTFDAGDNAELVCLGHEEGDEVQIDSIDSNGQLTQAYINNLVAVRGDGATFTGWKEVNDEIILTAANQPVISTSKQFKRYVAQFSSSSTTYTFQINTALGEKWHYNTESTADSVYDANIKTSHFPTIEREGYHFVIWKDVNSSTTFPDPTDLPDEEDVTCEAIWTPIHTFIPTAGTWTDTETSVTREFYGDFVLPSLTKIGCYDLVWSPTLPVAPATWPAVPTTYTASWSEYQFTFHAQSGTWTIGGGSADKVYGASAVNRPATLPEITRSGYYFRGWNTASDATGDWLANAAALPDYSNGEYYAIWSEIFTFYPNSGSWTNGDQDNPRVLYKYNITASDIAISYTDYYFNGWNPSFDIENLPSASGSFTAQWLPEYTFNPNGGTWTDETTANKVITTAIDDTPAKNGYAFTGWDNSYNPASLPAVPTTFTAGWSTYTYTFDVATNEGTWDGSDDANKDFTITTISGLTSPQRTNFVFVGWNTAADGSGDELDTDHLPTANTTFYAQFSEVHFFTIKALENNVTIGTRLCNKPTVLPTLSYSTDGGATWNTLTLGATDGTKINLANAGDSVIFRGSNDYLNKLVSHIYGGSPATSPQGEYMTFSATGSVAISGNIMTLIQDVHPTDNIVSGDFPVFGPLFANMPVVDASKLELPTTTSYGCYEYMFYGCTSLTTPPVLPAAYAERSAYCGMFYGCTSLTTAPTIYAVENATTSSSNGAFAQMFAGCSNLNYINVKFHEWVLNANYYWVNNVASTGTFVCPSALAKTRGVSYIPANWDVLYIPELTFDLNGDGHWSDLSTDDLVLEPETALTTLPVAIPDNANRSFYGWNTSSAGDKTWLTIANQPVMSSIAQQITYYAIYSPAVPVDITFSLSNLPESSWNGSDRTDKVISSDNLLANGVPIPQMNDQFFAGWTTSPTGTTNELVLSNLPLVPTTYYPIFRDYVCITSLTDGTVVSSANIGTYTNNVKLQYCVSISDGGDGEWHTFTLGSTHAMVTLNENQKVYIRGYNPDGINNSNFENNKYFKFNISNSSNISGNIMTLLDSLNPPTVIPCRYCFCKLFKEDTGHSTYYCRIVDASNLHLPDTTAADCYRQMFEDCNYMVNPPALPNVTTVAHAAYREMFNRCTRLTSFADLTADSICTAAYYGMFRGCTSMVNAPTIYATRIEESGDAGTGAMVEMFYDCTKLRTMDVYFNSWGSGSPASSAFPTYHWMTGTTTNELDNAKFYGPASLSVHPQDPDHIQVNWNAVITDVIITRDTLSEDIQARRNVFVTNGATLTLNGDYRALNLTVNAGCRVVVPYYKTLTADTIFLQADGNTFTYPEMVINGHIKTPCCNVTPIYYDYRINKKQCYTLSLPSDVECKEVRYARNWAKAPFVVRDYNGTRRVTSGADGGNWTSIWEKLNPETAASTTLHTGKGYTIYCSAQKVDGSFEDYSYLRLPLHPDFRTAGEQSHSISVYGYGCTDGVATTPGTEPHVGWNLIGNPYFAKFGQSGECLQLSNDQVIDMVVMPNNDGTHYSVEYASSVVLPAFKNFFVQVFDNATLTYNKSTRANNAPARRAAMKDDVTTIITGISLTCNAVEDHMGLRISDNYSAAYDAYADMSKMMNQDINIYATVGTYDLSMAAVNKEIIANTIPLTVSTATAGKASFSIREDGSENTTLLTHLYLEDRTLGITTDLLFDNYECDLTEGTTAGRFFLSAEVIGNTSTDFDYTTGESNIEVIKFIENGQLFIRRNGILYDASGKRIEKR